MPPTRTLNLVTTPVLVLRVCLSTFVAAPGLAAGVREETHGLIWLRKLSANRDK
jgi:hypothetical protein